MPEAPWQSNWLRLHLLVRTLLALPVTPTVKAELERCAQLRQLLLHDGTLN